MTNERSARHVADTDVFEVSSKHRSTI